MTAASRALSLAVVAAIVGLACASPEPAPEAAQTLGFLENYEQLSPGRAHEARLLFIDDEADFSLYERAIVDPVVAWNGGERDEGLARAFDAALREELGVEFDLVEQPGQGTLRLRSAIAMKNPSLLGIEIEIVDAASGERLVAVVDERLLSTVDHDRARALHQDELARLASLIRARLATFRSFDASRRAREQEQAH